MKTTTITLNDKQLYFLHQCPIVTGMVKILWLGFLAQNNIPATEVIRTKSLGNDVWLLEYN
jgi:hypothetical protein